MKKKLFHVLGVAFLSGAILLGNGMTVQATSSTTMKSGSALAGVSVVLDAYYGVLLQGRTNVGGGLTKEKTDVYHLGVANVDGHLNIRTEPKDDATVVARLSKDGACRIVAEQDGWYQIQSGDVKGYVSDKYILTGAKAKEIAKDYEVLRDELPKAVKVTAEELAKEKKEGNRRQVVNYAMRFVGNRYEWGGTNPNTGADCSGFVQYVLRNAAGISLNRTSREQVRQGQGIASGQMEPGDLIFYGNSSGSINHVALYIGEGQIVHAASKKSGIKVSKWNYRKPVAIRNILGS